MEKERGGITPTWAVVVLTIACTFGCTVPQGTTPRIATGGGWCSASINTYMMGVEYDKKRGFQCQLELGARNVPDGAQYGVPRHAWTNFTLGGKVLGAAPAEETMWAGFHTQFEFLYVPEEVEEQHGPPKAQAEGSKALPPSEVPSSKPYVTPLAATTWPWDASEVTPSTPAKTPPSPEMVETPEPSEAPEPPAPFGE